MRATTTARDNEGNKGEVTNIIKMTIYCRVYKRGVKFVVVVFVSSTRWVMSVDGMVESKGSSRTIVAGSWCWSSR